MNHEFAHRSNALRLCSWLGGRLTGRGLLLRAQRGRYETADEHCGSQATHEASLYLPLVSLLSFLEWLAGTAWSVALHESLYMYPLIESTHVITLTLYVGLAVILDLRLGLILRSVPVSQILTRVLPWTKAGFVIMFTTGLLLFYAIPVRNYQNIFFRVKVIMLILAGINVWYFHTRIERTVPEWDLSPAIPKAARAAAVISLVLWAGIVVTGRMIAYNWFDCDIQPQSAFINWAAGCVVAKPE
jgi:hypothetical protein